MSDQRQRTSEPPHRDANSSRYDLRASQITTPTNVIRFFWEVVARHRDKVGAVLDMGAGDGRFARYGKYASYTGVEVDSNRLPSRLPTKRTTLTTGCVFEQPPTLYDACIGNPPYLRHHDIESPWKEKTLAFLGRGLGRNLSGHANLFLYFMALGILRSAPDGIVALLIPFDWVTRPAAGSLRSVIREHRWAVSVYKFTFPIFKGVDTTACISIIDKRQLNAAWHYYDVAADFATTARRGVTGSGRRPLDYARRTERRAVFARRGMSPGTQRVFTLTEGERVHHGLWRSDVVPCVTSLRGFPVDQEVLNEETFQQLFVATGRRCWLIRSRGKLSDRLRAYLDGIPEDERSTATCKRQDPWYHYEAVPAPSILLHSSFTSNGPKAVVNAIGAIPVGTMYGIYGCADGQAPVLRRTILMKKIPLLVVPHSRNLRKIEVGQLNTLLRTVSEATDG